MLNKCPDELFLDFIKRCLDWNPLSRMTPLEALQHEWILSGLPEKVLIHHTQMFSGKDSVDFVKQGTMTAIQGFPAEAASQSINDIVRELKRNERQIALESPPSPPSVAFALAQIKKNGIEKQ